MSKVYEEKSTTYFKGTSKSRLSKSDGTDKLPSDLVTNDPGDAARIHAVDPEHVKHEILNQYLANDHTPTAPDYDADKRKKHDLHEGKVSERGQHAVDVIRLSIMSAVLGTCVSAVQAGREPDLSVRHIWFPEDDMSKYELRRGNPPPDCDRPKHLKRLSLEIDPNVVPPYLSAAMKKSSGGRQDLDELHSLRHSMYTETRKSDIII